MEGVDVATWTVMREGASGHEDPVGRQQEDRRTATGKDPRRTTPPRARMAVPRAHRHVAQSAAVIQIKFAAICGEPEVEWCAVGLSRPRSRRSPLSHHRQCGNINILCLVLPDR